MTNLMNPPKPETQTQSMSISAPGGDGNPMSQALASRQFAEVMGMLMYAQQKPRDINRAIANITTSCQRPRLALGAIYKYSRGGSKIEGPSIRLAEVLAQNWGNMDFGIVELERKRGESTAMSYAWDLETNVRETKVFTVRHRRDTKSGGYELKDERDIYELIANMGARRLRACILGVIPIDIQEEAVEQCRNTMIAAIKGDNTEPFEDKVRKMLKAFHDSFQVSQEMIEARIQHNVEAMDAHELYDLRTIFTSLKEGASKREDWFVVPESPASTKGKDVIKKARPTKSSRKKKTQSEVQNTEMTDEEKRAIEAAEANEAEAAMNDGQSTKTMFE
jgi:hypothetical protein